MTKVLLRLPNDLYATLRDLASTKGMSVDLLVIWLIRRALNHVA